MGRRRLNIILITAMVSCLLVCENPMLDTLKLVVKDFSTPETTISHEDGSGISNTTKIVITFSETIDTNSLIIGGNLASVSDGGEWSSDGGNPDDTLTISPKTVWPFKSGKTLTVDCADFEEYAIPTISVTYGVLDGIVYVHAEKGSDSNPGTDDLPKKTIQAAVFLAGSLYAESKVRVAEGTYQSNNPVTISKNVSLYGGYSADNWGVRETDLDWPLSGESEYITTIKTIYTSTGVQGEEVSALYITNLTEDIVIKGFYIKGAAGDSSNAILINNCSPVIRSNSIDAGSGLSSIGIAVNYGSPLIEYNSIYGGENDLSTGLFNYESNPTIDNNYINGGTGSNTTAVYNIGALSIITCNTLFGGNCRESANGIANEAGSDCIIRNNIINAGTAESTSGIRNKGSSPYIQNNTIHGGGASNLEDSIAEGMWNYNSSNPVIENNIIFTGSGYYRYGISQGDISSAPTSLKNNDIFDCPDYLYINVDYAEGSCTTVEQLNALSYASGNIDTSSTTLDELFIHPSEPDSDWHLEAGAPVNIRQGGLDLSTSFTDDMNGTLRTNLTEGPNDFPDNNGAAGWSMGAYEKD